MKDSTAKDPVGGAKAEIASLEAECGEPQPPQAELVITTQKELEDYMRKYGCKTVGMLDDVLWFDYGVALSVDIK